MSYHKHSLPEAIHGALLPFLDIPEDCLAEVADELVSQTKIYRTVKYQLIEEPGPADDGQFMLVLQGLVDSYYQCPFTRKLRGRYVFYRHDAIFAAESFYGSGDRRDYIRALEATTLLALPYPTLRVLAERYLEVSTKLKRLMATQTQYLLLYNLRNTLPAHARIRAFLEQHPTLPHRTTAEVCAMHNHMSRYWFGNTLKKLRD